MADHPPGRPIRGVCVVTVERQGTAPTLITILVVHDLGRPGETVRRYVADAGAALDDVRAFLTMIVDAGRRRGDTRVIASGHAGSDHPPAVR